MTGAVFNIACFLSPVAEFAALQAPFIDPVTGAQPGSPFGTGAGAGGMGGMVMGGRSGGGGGMPVRSSGSDRSAAETAALRAQPIRTSGGGTGSFGLPDPMSGSFAGTNFPGAGGRVVNAVTRSATGGGGSSGMGGGK